MALMELPHQKPQKHLSFHLIRLNLHLHVYVGRHLKKTQLTFFFIEIIRKTIKYIKTLYDLMRNIMVTNFL